MSATAFVRPLLALFAAAGLLAGCVGARGAGEKEMAHVPPQTGVLFRSVELRGSTFAYAVYIPRGYDPTREWPCVVFLNGRGECGRDGQRHLSVGMLPAILNNEAEWPCIAVFPQKPDQESEWADHEQLVLEILAAAKSQWKVDASRVALTGLSQGGAGTWMIGSRHPETFSRLAPICGYGEPALIAAGASALPVWAFHGERDDIVKPEQTRAIVAAIKATNPNASVRATYYPDANHNSWDRAYRNEKLGLWLTQPR
ncbi:MAG: dienelactone hydrolase family protein [Phycisphaerales bacterium]